MVFLTHGNELFARCFHRYYNGTVAERQRYVFAKDGYCRYGVEFDAEWRIRSKFREPVFTMQGGYNADNSYTVLNVGAIRRSCMRYSLADEYGGDLLMNYLALYVRHPNIEYLVKSGYSQLIVENGGSYWSYRPTKIAVDDNVDLRSNNLLKMLGLNRTEFKALRGSEKNYFEYITWRNIYPKFKPEEILAVIKAFGCEFGTAEKLTRLTGARLLRLAKYLSENKIRLHDYEDYLDQCIILHYDLRDTAVCIAIVDKLPDEFVTSMSQIGTTKMLFLSTLSEEERSEIVENTDLESASVRELERKIKQLQADKDRAVAEKSAAEAENAARGNAVNALEKTKRELEKRISSLESEIKALENRPIETAVEYRDKIPDDYVAREAYERTVRDYTAQLEQADNEFLEEKRRAHAEKTELEKQLENVKQQLEAANNSPEKVDAEGVFKAYFTNAYNALNTLAEYVQEHSEFAPKVGALVDNFKNSLEGIK